MASASPIYHIYTTLQPEELEDFALEIYKDWLAFAEGRKEFNGKIIRNPSGNYAKALRIEKLDLNHVAIIADEHEAPEALSLEVGHGPIDLKRSFAKGEVIPIHRAGNSFHYPSLGGNFNPNLGMRANGRGQFVVGFARMGSTGWVIPPMRASYAVREIAREAAKRVGGTLA